VFGAVVVATMLPHTFPDKRAPAAIITKAWRPILIIGAVGGVIIAVLEPRFVR